jgi:hypothetical protein
MDNRSVRDRSSETQSHPIDIKIKNHFSEEKMWIIKKL